VGGLILLQFFQARIPVHQASQRPHKSQVLQNFDPVKRHVARLAIQKQAVVFALLSHPGAQFGIFRIFVRNEAVSMVLTVSAKLGHAFHPIRIGIANGPHKAHMFQRFDPFFGHGRVFAFT
jgi:hypothetical protein